MVDYGFYAGTYGGSSIPAAAFDSYIRAADAHLERYRQIYTLSPRREDGEKMSYLELVHQGKDLISEHYGWIFLGLGVCIVLYILVHRLKARMAKPAA